MRTLAAAWTLSGAFALAWFAPPLRAADDDRTRKMLDGLAREAAAFESGATQVAGVETQRQRILKPPAKFRPRVGKAAKSSAPEWQDKEVVSEYAFARAGNSLHEIREVIRVDGKRVQPEQQAGQRLARAATLPGDEGRRESLLQLEKYGLKGAITDTATLLLLFKPGYVERYEIEAIGPRAVEGTPAYVFRYKQIEGTGGITVFDGQGAPRRLKVEGEIWSRTSDWTPLRIIMTASDGEGAAELREETSVQYEMSPFQVLLPKLIRHREIRGGTVTADRTFSYTDFRKMDSSPSSGAR